MNLGAPLALAGFALLAIPIVIHLMGLGRARQRPFPSLRFIDTSRLRPSRRTQIQDMTLLAVRLVVIAAAVAALARPLVSDRAAFAAGDGLAVAVIVDTSASMARAAVSSAIAGEASVLAARRVADSAVTGATVGMVIESAYPASQIAGAAAWLASKAGRRELVIISDFQVGTFDRADLVSVPPSVGVRAVRVGARGSDASESRLEQGGRQLVARAEFVANRTQVTWTAVGAATTAAEPELLAAAGELSGARAARTAAGVLGRPVRGSFALMPVAIVYPRFAVRPELVRGSAAPGTVWQADLIQRLRSDELLTAAALEASPAGPIESSATIIARARDGTPIVAALPDSSAGASAPPRLLIVMRADAGSAVSVALHAALARAHAPPASELDPAVLSDSAVQLLARMAVEQPPPLAATDAATDENAQSYARWFWILAIVALIGESILRRTMTARATVSSVGNVGR